MDDMPATTHAKPVPRRDHLWVLVIIAACALIETFPSWVGIGAVSGFPHFGRIPTDWTLAVTSEAYWGYALYAGIVAAVGPRSRAFALWSAGGVFALSLIGQAAYHLMAAAHRTAPPQWVVVSVAALPVIVLALTAILVHLRHLDRAEAEAAERAQIQAGREAQEATAADTERAALRADAEAARAERDEANADLTTARTELSRLAARAEALERKLAAQKPKPVRRKPANAGPRKAPNPEPNAPHDAEVPDDIDARSEAFSVWLDNPKISGKDLGAAVGLGERWGQLRKAEFAAAAPADPSREEAS